MRPRTLLSTLPTVLAVLSHAVAAQQLDSALVPGAVTAEVVSISDSTQRYAVFAPSSYDPTSQWPALIVMDPRGRALVPLSRLQPAAEERGYVIVSSYNTRSDGPAEPTVTALDAMIADLSALSPIDSARLYLVGFSGTARLAWEVGFRMPGRVAGVLGFGAGSPWAPTTLRATVRRNGAPFVFFGGAGLVDFNFFELRALDSTLDTLGVRHRIEYYEGPHAWPQSKEFTRAVEWIELQAVRDGLRPNDTAWVAAVLNRRIGEANEMRADGRLLEALVRHRAIIEDFASLQDVSGSADAAAELAELESVRQAEARLDRLFSAYVEYVSWLDQWLEDVRRLNEPPSLVQAKERLWIDRLQRSAGSGDSLGGPAAQRMLETAFVRASFYEPQVYFERGDPRRALATLEVAHVIKPDDGPVCHDLARAHAALGEHAQAIEALECLVATTGVSADQLEQSPYFAPLLGEPAFVRLLGKLRAGHRDHF